eukprot:PITA_15100
MISAPVFSETLIIFIYGQEELLEIIHSRRLAIPEVGMGNQTEYNILRYSAEADCSHYDAAGKIILGTHYDAAGKTILGKRKIEENPNMDNSLKHVHLSKLKKQKPGKTVNPDHSEVLNKIVGKRIIEKDNNRSEESNLIPELKKPTKPSAVRDFRPGCGRYTSAVAPVNYKCLPQKIFTPPVSDFACYTSTNGRIVPSVRKEQYQLSASPETHNNLYVNTGEQIVGAVPGVEVGDQFRYRIELCIVGLHRQIQAGIDFLKQGNVTLATSIVASGGYEDDIDGGDVLIYTGHGGNNYSGDKRQNKHQKLERGNLALKNCIDRKTPVRVIRGYKQTNTGIHENKKGTVNVIYTYDGLYDVQTYWLDKGVSGYSVFKFQLKRQHGQPELGLKAVQFIGREQKHLIREGLRVKDISGGKERKYICAVNTIDEESLPTFFYTTKVIYPYGCKPEPPKGCECKDGCLDPSKCFCASKNGGEFPFNYDGAIVYPKPIVYECGPSCKCRGTCHNRVSQHGVRHTLEVFKTDKRGWGVRSLDSIPSGSFICEYTGNLLSDTEAEKRVGNDEYLFDIGRNCNSRDQSLWSDLLSLMPDIEARATSDMVEDGGFMIDAAKCGNVGRFVNHSCSPNLYAQNVLYDHDDRKLPHIMLFAAENIPPMRELCYHYNYSLDEVRDSDGNIKTKPCYCGSSQCTGRMY